MRQHLYIQNHALRCGSVEDMAHLVRDERIAPSVIHFRSTLTLEVSCEPLPWLTESVLVGTGARHRDRVRIAIYRVL